MKSHVNIQLFEPQPGTLYTLEQASCLAGISRRSVLVYCNAGLIQPVLSPPFGALYFTEEAIQSLRRIEFLRQRHGINLTGVRIIFGLMEEVEQLREQLQHWQR